MHHTKATKEHGKNLQKCIHFCKAIHLGAVLLHTFFMHGLTMGKPHLLLCCVQSSNNGNEECSAADAQQGCQSPVAIARVQWRLVGVSFAHTMVDN